MEAIRKGWNHQTSSLQSTLSDRIKSVRKEISKWKRATKPNSKLQIERLRRDIEFESTKPRPDFDLLATWNLNLEKAYNEEEIFWKQKSKDKWVLDGDQNTNFFQGSVQTRKMRNKISCLLDIHGVEQFQEDVKGGIAVAYFERLFTSTVRGETTELLNGLEAKVTNRMNNELIKQVTDSEIKRAVKAIKGDSAPGADGMTGIFFQQCWSLIAPSVIKEVKEFFEKDMFPVEWNFTQLCLIPKKTNPNNMSDLRPISLCSSSYKIVAKILCTRLKKILPFIISQNQGAFVGGRLISDNLLLAHELTHGLRTNAKCRGEFLAIKTDMSKAYDRVEWNFLEVLFT